ncbi:hypothetical protein AB1Y20_005206 [Prymnesium parvum]|uniref:Uncharacterized protein n=1 Tax=Prymnesium parvum TaxID=97485 RepID=A0AB34J5H1_PRYPA
MTVPRSNSPTQLPSSHPAWATEPAPAKCCFGDPLFLSLQAESASAKQLGRCNSNFSDELDEDSVLVKLKERHEELFEAHLGNRDRREHSIPAREGSAMGMAGYESSEDEDMMKLRERPLSWAPRTVRRQLLAHADGAPVR